MKSNRRILVFLNMSLQINSQDLRYHKKTTVKRWPECVNRNSVIRRLNVWTCIR